MFLHVSVILFTGLGLPHCMLGYTPPPGPEAGPIACWDTPPPRTRHPLPGTRQPLGPDTPPEQCMLGDTGNKRAVSILLECNLVYKKFKINVLFSQSADAVLCSFDSNYDKAPGFLLGGTDPLMVGACKPRILPTFLKNQKNCSGGEEGILPKNRNYLLSRHASQSV